MSNFSLKNDNKPNRSFDTMRVTQFLLGLEGLIWAGFGIISLQNMTEKYPDQTSLYGLIALMMFGNALAMLLSAWLIVKRKRIFYLFSLVILLVNLLLTFTDQVGTFDLATLILDLIICGILISRRTTFLPG